MLTFILADAVEAARGRNPTQQYLFGNDEIPITAEIERQPGLVRATTQAPEAAGIAVQIDLDALGVAVGRENGEPLGKVTLTTCLLPHREKPYVLALELARKRVMQLVHKLEEWGMFDLGPDDPAIERYEAARRMFTEALVAQRRSGTWVPGAMGESERLACLALLLAAEAGERLATRQTERLWSPRMSGDLHTQACAHYERMQQESPPAGAPILIPGNIGVVLPGRPMIGCSVSPAAFSEALGRLVMATCDFVSVPIRWGEMEPTEGKYAFAGTDRWIEWAVRTAKLPVVAGPLIDFRPSCVPEWLYIWENDYETLRELIAEHVKQIVTRYRRTVRRWTVASGLHVNSNFALGFEQMMDLTKVSVQLVRKLHPQANVVLEITQPWGEYYATNRKSVPPQLYADMIVQAGLPVDAFGIRLQLGQPRPGQAVRDLMAISSMLDRFAEFEKPIIVTAMGAPAGVVAAPRGENGKPGEPKTGADGSLEPGYWHRPWSEAQQAEWLGQVGAMVLAKPYVHSLCWHELFDTPAAPEMTSGGLISQTGTARPAMMKLAELRRGVREARLPGPGLGATPAMAET